MIDFLLRKYVYRRVRSTLSQMDSRGKNSLSPLSPLYLIFSFYFQFIYFFSKGSFCLINSAMQNQASAATHRRMDPLRRTGTGTVLSVPPLEKFRSGHLPRTSIPVSHTLRRDSSASGSDMDESSDTEPEIYPSRYSADSSPHEDIMNRRAPHAASRYAYYSSDGYTEMSSSRDTMFSQKPQSTKPDRVDNYVHEQEEESDSGGSSEFSRQPVRANGRAGVRSGLYNSSYAPSVASSTAEFGVKAGRSVKLPAEKVFFYITLSGQ